MSSSRIGIGCDAGACGGVCDRNDGTGGAAAGNDDGGVARDGTGGAVAGNADGGVARDGTGGAAGRMAGCDPGSVNRKSEGGGATAGAGPPGRTLGSAVASRSIVPRLPSGAGPSSWSRSFFAALASRPT